MSEQPVSFIKYNDIQFNIVLIVYDSDVSLTAPDLISNDNAYIVPANNIVYIGIENSIAGIVPTAEFEIKDSSNALPNVLAGQNVRLSITITQKSINASPTLSLTFLVKDYRILEMSTNLIRWFIKCELDNCVPLNTLCEYATACSLDNDIEMQENPYKIARNILTQVRL